MQGKGKSPWQRGPFAQAQQINAQVNANLAPEWPLKEKKRKEASVTNLQQRNSERQKERTDNTFKSLDSCLSI